MFLKYFCLPPGYLLSRIEGVSGSPEKPLSDLGRLSYESYWRSTLLPLIFNTEENNSGALTSDITVRQLTEATGIDVHDVVNTLQQLASSVQLDSQDGRLVNSSCNWGQQPSTILSANQIEYFIQ